MRAFACGMRMHVAISALTPFAVLAMPIVPLAYGVVTISLRGSIDIVTLVGVGLVSVSSAVIVHAASIVAFEKAWHSLEVGLISPTPIALPLLGRLFAAVLEGLAVVPVAWVVLAALWSWPEAASWPQVVTALLVGTVGLLGLGLVLMALLIRYRYFAGMVNGLYNVIALLCGFLVPVAALPLVAEWTSWLLGPSWAMEGLRHGEAGAGGWIDLGSGLVAGAVTMLAGVTYLVRVERTVRQHPQSLLQ